MVLISSEKGDGAVGHRSEAAPGFDLRAVGGGILWGLGVVLAGGVIQGVAGFSTALSPVAEARLAVGLQAAGCLVGGFAAARKASGSGWLHGASAGLGLVLVVAGLMGVASAFPSMAVLARAAALGTAVGALSGIAGVNSTR